MIQTIGRVTEVCKFSSLEDQITIVVSISSIDGEEENATALIRLFRPELSG